MKKWNLFKILSFFLVCLFLINFVSASFEVDNVKDYDAKTKTLTVTNAFGLGDTIAEVKLDSPLVNYVIRGEDRLVAEFTIDSKEDYENVFNNLEFYHANDNLRKFERVYTYRYKDKNGDWIDFDKKAGLEKGIKTIGIFTDVLPGDNVEWVPELFGVEVEEWAVWIESLNADIAHYYNFNQSTGTNLPDVVDATRNGTANAGVNWTDAGIIPNGTGYTSGDYYFNITGGNIFNNNSLGISTSIWFRGTDNSSEIEIYGDASGSNDWAATIQGDSLRVFTGNGDIDDVVPFDNEWKHLVVTWKSGEQMRVYINGTFITNESVNTVMNNHTSFVFGANSDGSDPWEGAIDEFGVWNRVLTDSEVIDLYNAGAGITYTDEFPVSVILDNPQNDTETFVKTLGFSANHTTTTSTLKNTTLFVWNSSGALFGNNEIDITGVQNFTNLTLNIPDQDTYKWNYYTCTIVECTFAISNRTIILSKIIVEDINFNTPVVEGSQETFELFVNSTEVITNSELIYNGTSHSTNILTLGGNSYQITSTIQIPDFPFDSTVPFLFSIDLTSGDSFNSSESTQEVVVLNIGNCTTYDEGLFNLTLFNERTLEDINGTIEVDLEILNEIDNSLINNVSTIFKDIHLAEVCSDLNITGSNFLYNLEVRYFSSPDNGTTFNFVPEFYHIQNADISGLPQEIPLYDLNANESTEFTIFYRDNNYIARENVLFQIQRKYVNEGIFRVIEIPISSNEGSAVGHFDLNNYKYKITVTKDGKVLNQFTNPSIRCESELSGICTITLKGLASTPSADFVSETENFFYTATQTNESVIIDYSIPTGESKVVTISMVQDSAFANPIILCNQTILSSAGSIECNVNATIGDSSVTIRIMSDDESKANLIALFQEDLQTSFLLNNYFIGAILLITLILMFITSTNLMMVSSVFGLVFLGFVFLLKSSSITLMVGAISWLLLAVIIILIKLNKKEEQ